MIAELFGDSGDAGALGAIPLTEAFPDDFRLVDGDFLLLQKLGVGGMGEVWRARHLITRREVAIKLLLPGAPWDRFRREVAILGMLEHPGIVRLYQSGFDRSQPYLAMELIEGPNLGTVLGEAPFTSRQAAKCAREVAEALAFAHSKGILHRDIKPSNVLMESSGRFRLTDFGLAREIVDVEGLTATGELLGTPSYMAPEQIEPGRGPVTGQSDVYGVGATLYHALTGVAPFRGGGKEAILRLVLEANPACPSQLVASIPRDLEVICLKAMAPNPRDRYPTAQSLAEDLQRYLDGDPILARPAPLVRVIAGVAKRRPGATGAVAAAVFSLLLGLILISRERVRLADANSALNETVGRLRLSEANHLFDSGQTSDALRLLAAECREHPGNWKAGLRLKSALQQRRFLMPSAVIGPHADLATDAIWSYDSRWLAVSSEAQETKVPILTLLDVDRANVAATREFEMGTKLAGISPDSRFILLVQSHGFRLVPIESFALPSSDLVATNDVTALGFDPVHHTLLAVDGTDSISRWQLTPFRRESSWRAPGTIRSFDIAGNTGTGLVLLSDGSLRLLDLESGDMGPPKYRGLTNGSNVLASPDAKKAWITLDASVKGESKGVLLDLIQWREMHTGRAEDGAFSPDSKWLLIDIDGAKAELVDAATGKQLSGAWTNTWVDPAHAFTPDSRAIFVRSEHSKALLRVRIPSGEPDCEPVFHGGYVTATSVSPDGRWVAVTAYSTNTVLWHATPVAASPVFAAFGEGPGMGFSPDGSLFASSRSNRLQIWKPGNWEPMGLPIELDDNVFRIRYSANGGVLAASASHEVVVVTLDGNKTVRHLRNASAVRAFDISADGALVVIAGEDHTVSVWDTTQGRLTGEPHPVTAHRTPNWSDTDSPLKEIRIDSAGRRLAVALYQGEVQVFEMGSNKPLAVLYCDEPPGQMEFDSEGSRLAVATLGNAASVWDLRSQPPHKTVLPHDDTIPSIEFSRDGKRVVTASYDGMGRVWDAATGHLVAQTEHRIGRMYQARFDLKGRIFAAASPEQGVCVWDAETGQALSEPLFPHSDCVRVSLGKDAQFLALQGPRIPTTVVELGSWSQSSEPWLPALAEALAGGRIEMPSQGDKSPAAGILRALDGMPSNSHLLRHEVTNAGAKP